MGVTIFSQMTFGEIAHAAHAREVRAVDMARRHDAVSTDSRSVSGGDIFFALCGEHFDAHDFIGDAIGRGCRSIVVSREVEVPEDVNVIVVDDVQAALGDLAREIVARRRSFGNFEIYAVTGSSGKTTTKELLSALLEAKGRRVLKTPANHNNYIGLPQTIFGMTKAHDVAVIEMGANAAGEIRYLSGIVKPDIGVITCVGDVHLEGFGTREGVARAKGELLLNDSLRRVILPAETRIYYEHTAVPCPVTWVGDGERIRVERLEPTADGIVMDYVDDVRGVRYRVHLPLLGAHNGANLAKALAAVDETWEPGELDEALSRVRLPSGRLEKWRDVAGGVCYLHDAYNANPGSMGLALDLLSQIAKPAHRFCILGDMLELGERSDEFHVAVGAHVARIGCSGLLCVGGYGALMARGARENGMDAARIHVVGKAQLESGFGWIRERMGDGDICLVKGSHSVGLERVIGLAGAVREGA